MEIYLKESLQNKFSPKTATVLTKPVVRSLAADLAHVFSSGQLSEKDFRKLPKNLQNEITALQNKKESIPIPEITKERAEATMEMPAIVANTIPENKKEEPILETITLDQTEKQTTEEITENLPQQEVPEMPERDAEPTTIPVFTADAIKTARQNTKTARENLFKDSTKEEDRVVLVKATKEVSATVPITSVTGEAVFNTREPHEDVGEKIKETLSLLDEKDLILENIKQKESSLQDHIEELKKKTDPIRQKERELEEAITILEKSNQGQINKEKIEERWRLENERRAIEESRWAIDEEKVGLHKELAIVLSEKESTEKTIKDLREKIEALRGKEERMLLLVERQKIEERLLEIAKSEEPLELEWIRLNEQKVDINKQISPLKGVLDGAGRDYRTLNLEEKNTFDPTKEHEIESKRWKIEERRRKAEEELLMLNEKLQELEMAINTLTATYQRFLKEEEGLKNRIQEINVRSSRLPN
jgi:hypothetical protein